MQQPTHPLHPGPQMPPANITTEQIQKCLDENKQLILAIFDNQSLGKLADCAQYDGPGLVADPPDLLAHDPAANTVLVRYQAQLQKNLLFLAAIADAQPQVPTVRPPMMPHAAMQQGGHYMPQPPIFPPRAPFNPQAHEQQQQHQLHHQPQLLPLQGNMAMRPAVMNGMHPMHPEASRGGSGNLPPGSSMAEFSRGSTPSNSVDGQGSKQDACSESATVTDGHRSSATEHGSGDAELFHVKRPEDGKS